ncbi:MAG TPA: CHAT domain-containing protein [bacterium]|nr:CHAT domain-containing protein [bacterium]
MSAFSKIRYTAYNEIDFYKLRENMNSYTAFLLILLFPAKINSQNLREHDSLRIVRLFQSAENSNKSGNIDSALFYNRYAASLALKYKLWNQYSTAVAQTTKNLIQKNKAKDAISECDSAIQHIIRSDNKSFGNISRLLNNKSIALRRLSDYNQALESVIKAVSLLQENNVEPNKEILADCFGSMTNIYYDMGKYRDAMIANENQRRILSSIFGRNNTRIAGSYSNQGLNFHAIALYDSAITYFDSSISIHEACGNSESLDYASALSNKGISFFEKGDFKKALLLYNQALELRKRLVGDKFLYIAGNYANIGVTYHELGDYDASIIYMEKALSILNQLNITKHPFIGGIFANIGISYRSKKDYETAVKYVFNALRMRQSLFEMAHPHIGDSYNDLGNIYFDLGDYKSALIYYDSASYIKSQTTSASSPQMAKLYSSKAALYSITGILDSAKHYYKLAAESWKLIYGEKHYMLSLSIMHLADLEELNNLDSTIHMYQTAICTNTLDFDDTNVFNNPNVESQILSYDVMVQLLSNKARYLLKIYSEKKDTMYVVGAYNALEIAHLLINQKQRTIITDNAKFSNVSIGQDVIDDLLETLYMLDEIRGTKNAAEMYKYVVKAKSSIFIESLKDLEITKGVGDGKLLMRENDLREQVSQREIELAKKLESNKFEMNDHVLGIKNDLFDLKEEHASVISELKKTFPSYYNLKYPSSEIDISEIQRGLNDNTALIEYFMGKKKWYVFVITNDDFEVFRFSKDTVFDPTIDQYLKSVRTINKPEFVSSSYSLYKKLIAPLDKLIDSKKHWIIIPDGKLYSVPFESLISAVQNGEKDFTKLKYLIHRHDIRYHYSAALFLRASENKIVSQSPTFLGFAPIFSDSLKNGHILTTNTTVLDTLSGIRYRFVTDDSKELMPLPHSETEVANIVSLFEKKAWPARAYFHRQATESNFKNFSEAGKFLHIATHGLINLKKPKLSALLFSQPQNTNQGENSINRNGEPVDDGVLYSGEIYNLNLKADLVTLSSCESGIGEYIRGEGMMTLTRGFLYAGSNNILFSLWKVPDESTSRLMTEFYRQCLTNKNYSESLREAKLLMIKKQATSFPLNWSGFVLIGR